MASELATNALVHAHTAFIVTLEARDGVVRLTVRDDSLSLPARRVAQVMDATDMKDRVADAISRLPEREKLVVALYYYENLTLREIGEVLGVTESRVSQLHTKAVLRLRSRLQAD